MLELLSLKTHLNNDDARVDGGGDMRHAELQPHVHDRDRMAPQVDDPPHELRSSRDFSNWREFQDLADTADI